MADITCRDFCITISKCLDEYYDKVYDKDANQNYNEEFISNGFYDQDLLTETERENRFLQEYNPSFSMTNKEYIDSVICNWQVDEVVEAINIFTNELPSNIPAFLYTLATEKLNAKEFFTEMYESKKESLKIDTYAKEVDKNDIINTDAIIKLFELFTNISADYFDIAVDAIKINNKNNDTIIEVVINYMCSINPERVFELLKQDFFVKETKMIALNLLAETEYKSEELYQTLRSMFKNAASNGEKLEMFITLGLYGNPRAIPMLKKFLRDVYGDHIVPPKDQQERNTLLTMFNIITDLGGSVEDLIS